MKNQNTLFKGSDGRNYILPFILVTVCFALWGFANDVTNPMVKAFSKIFRMSVTDGALIQVAFYGGYFAMALPAFIKAALPAASGAKKQCVAVHIRCPLTASMAASGVGNTSVAGAGSGFTPPQAQSNKEQANSKSIVFIVYLAVVFSFGCTADGVSPPCCTQAWYRLCGNATTQAPTPTALAARVKGTSTATNSTASNVTAEGRKNSSSAARR